MAAKPIEFIPTKPYRFSDRRSSTGYRNDTLYQGSQRTGERKWRPPTDRDTHQNVSNYGRRQLMTLGRAIYGNMPTIAGAIEEQAALTAEVFIPQYYGADKEWGTAAEDWLLNWNQICMVEADPYDFDTYLEQLSISFVRDGDMGTLLTETPEGYPQVQMVPGHRIGSVAESIVEAGEFQNFPIVDGVILSPQRRAIAYRIYSEDWQTFEDVSARNMFLSFIPQWSDQVRGFSKLASAIMDLQAFKDSRDNELLAQIVCSGETIHEHNDTGQFDAAKASLLTARTFNASNQNTGVTVETLEGGRYRYLRANSGNKLESFHYDRPGSNVMNYQENVARDCFRSIDWDYYFSVDPSKVGGASLRIIIDKINRVLSRRRRMLKKAARRIHGYALAKAMKIGLLPWNDDWWKWIYQTSGKLTADAQYDSSVSVQGLANVIVSPQRVCGERGEYWEDVQDEWMDAQARFQRLAKEKGVDLAQVRFGTSVAAYTPVENMPPKKAEGEEPEE